MTSFSVRPDDLTVAGAGTSADADALRAAATLVATAGRVGAESLEPSARVVAALADYVHLDGMVAAALGDAAGILGEGFVQAADRYRLTEGQVAAVIGSGSRPGDTPVAVP